MVKTTGHPEGRKKWIMIRRGELPNMHPKSHFHGQVDELAATVFNDFSSKEKQSFIRLKRKGYSDEDAIYKVYSKR